jgi:hypothetical protein
MGVYVVRSVIISSSERRHSWLSPRLASTPHGTVSFPDPVTTMWPWAGLGCRTCSPLPLEHDTGDRGSVHGPGGEGAVHQTSGRRGEHSFLLHLSCKRGRRGALVLSDLNLVRLGRFRFREMQREDTMFNGRSRRIRIDLNR